MARRAKNRSTCSNPRIRFNWGYHDAAETATSLIDALIDLRDA